MRTVILPELISTPARNHLTPNHADGTTKPTTLRHTTATLLKDLGVPPGDTMEILGHSRIAVTMEIRTAADNVSRREAIDKLNALFGTDSD